MEGAGRRGKLWVTLSFQPIDICSNYKSSIRHNAKVSNQILPKKDGHKYDDSSEGLVKAGQKKEIFRRIKRGT